jgi:stage II sporulation protein D
MPRLGIPLLAGLLTASLAAVLPAEARAADRSDVPDPASIRIDGRGFGHGKGLSQYGAEGAARQGRTHQQILAFYYPGTTESTFSTKVSVLLSGTRKHLVVNARPGLSVRDLGARRTRKLPARGKRWRLVGLTSGRTRVDLRTGKRWSTWRTLRGEGQFQAGGKPITLRTRSGPRAYRGTLRSAAPTAGARRRDTVNVLALEKYLRGVVPTEIPATWSPSAVQAQAVAARTYAAFELLAAPRSRHYQICDTTACQVYRGHAAEHPASDAAIRATRKKVLTHGGAPAFTQFSSSNGGWSVAGSMPYLTAQQDPYDGWAGNPNHTWRTTVTDATIEKRWPALGNLTEIKVLSRDGNGEWGGRVSSLRLTGSRSSLTLTGDAFRFGLGLRSTWFTATVS